MENDNTSNNVLQACVVLIRQIVDSTNEEKFLCISRKDNHEIFGLPGGKVENDETLLEAAVRELFEETDVVVDPHSLQLFFSRVEPPINNDGKYFLVHYFYAPFWSGEPKAKENQKIAWLTKSELTIERPAFKHLPQVIDTFEKCVANFSTKVSVTNI